jgi:hypothetical protein
MRRMILVPLVAVGAQAAMPGSAYADINDNPECQRQFMALARPYVQRMLWFGSVSGNYRLTANGRYVVTGGPYSAYGPGNGYGPRTPYGPNFGPRGVFSFGPGFGGPSGYGYGPNGVGRAA